MSDFLAVMARESSRRARIAQSSRAELEARIETAVPPLPLRLSDSGFDVIAEVKLASPSEGRLTVTDGTVSVGGLAREYVAAGAVALSVLTERTRFDGDLSHLEEVSGEAGLPAMRKDFLVDPIQVLEARAHGASGVLLIARMLPGDLLAEMTDLAIGLGMFVLVEVFERPDLGIAARVFDRDVLLGVNSRDLVTLEVEPTRFSALAPYLPDHLHAVAESGIATVEQASEVASLGYRLALVGSSLVSASRRGERLQELIEAGRAARSGIGT